MAESNIQTVQEIEIPAPFGRAVIRSGVGKIILGFAFVWIAIIVAMGLFADLIAPFDPNTTDLLNRLQPPAWADGSWEHALGTDNIGRDLLSRLIHATRLSVLIALIGTVTGAILGTTLGLIAAHFRGWVDDVIMALVDFQAAMPFLVIAIAVVAFAGPSLTVLLIMVGIYGWERFARLARSLALSTSNDAYVVAARAYGTRPLRLYLRHILPNVAAMLIVNLTLNFPETVLLESALSFLGLGVQPPNASLGTMLSQGRDYLVNAWWIAVFPGTLIFLTTLSMSLIGDRLRDNLDKESSPID